MPKTARPCKNARATVQKRTHNNDLTIPSNVAWRDDLSWEIKVFYGIIRVLSKNEYYCCFASNEYLCETLKKADNSTIRRYLSTLESKELIKRDNTYVIDEYGNYQYSRALVPIDLYNKFLKKKDETLDFKGSQKNSRKTVQNCTPTPCKNAHQILNMLPCEKNNTNHITSSLYNPQTPLQGGNNAVASVENEQFEVLGKFGNVRLTKTDKTAFKGEFGAAMLSSLVEQLDCYIEADSRRKKRYGKKSAYELYITLVDWALRRKEVIASKEQCTTTRVLIGGRDMERRPYTEDDFNALFTKLDEDD